MSEPFETTIGTPQDDGLSPILCTVYFERAVRDIWEALPPRPLCDSELPTQMIFADDTDFPSHSKPYLEEAETIIPVVLKKNSLTANEDKWNR